MNNNIVLYGGKLGDSLEYLVMKKGYKIIDQNGIYELNLHEIYRDVFEKTQPKYHDDLMNDLVKKHLPLHLKQNRKIGSDFILDNYQSYLKTKNNVIINPFTDDDLINYKNNGMLLVEVEKEEYDPLFWTIPHYVVDKNRPAEKQLNYFLHLVEYLKGVKF